MSVCITLYNYIYIVTAKIFCNKLYFEIGYHNQYMNIIIKVMLNLSALQTIDVFVMLHK